MMKNKFLGFFTALLVLVYPIQSFSTEINGAGRRIPAPIFELWAKHYSSIHPNTAIKYQAVSAAEGLKQIMAGMADFGETDSPLSKEELEAKGLYQFPYMFSGITPVVNLPGINVQIQLTGKVLADIFLGKITKWNDAEITAVNGHVPLPNKKIIVAHLVPDRGTTYHFTAYLSKISPEWAERVGTSAAPKWPVGESVENLYKMGDFIKATPYSIGVSENSYARKNGLTYVKLQNKNGIFITPNTGSIRDAVKDIQWNINNGLHEEVMDVTGSAGWPITEASYLLIRRKSENPEQGAALLKFLSYGLSSGYFDVISLDFVPIERPVFALIRGAILTRSTDAKVTASTAP